MYRRAKLLQRPRDNPGSVVAPDIAAEVLLEIAHAGVGHASTKLRSVKAHDTGGDIVPVLGTGEIRQILQRAGDHHVQIEIDPAVLPQGQVSQHIGHVADGPVALLQDAAGVPCLQRRALHVSLRIDVPDLDVMIVEQVPDDLARAVGELGFADEQQIDGHRRVHPRRRFHGAGLPGVQHETLLAEAGGLVEEDVPSRCRFVDA